MRGGIRPHSDMKLCGLRGNFKELLQSWWSDFSFSGPYSSNLTEKLKTLKANLKACNKKILKKCVGRLKEAFEPSAFL